MKKLIPLLAATLFLGAAIPANARYYYPRYYHHYYRSDVAPFGTFLGLGFGLGYPYYRGYYANYPYSYPYYAGYGYRYPYDGYRTWNTRRGCY